MTDLSDLQNALGIGFRDLSLLRESLVHSSYLNENPDYQGASNERLEYLGDALLGLVIAEKLYLELPDYPEGELTKTRSALVCRETLARLAARLHLGDYLYLGHGEEASGGRHRQRNLAGAFEALLGAVLLDQGFARAKDLILNLFSDELARIAEQRLAVDHKSRLQEVLQQERKLTPAYRIVEAEGPDHARIFTVEVLAGDMVIGRGTGRSKQQAEKEAARDALESLPGGRYLRKD